MTLNVRMLAMQTTEPEVGDLITLEEPGGPAYLNFTVEDIDGRLGIRALFSGPIMLDALPPRLRVTRLVKKRERGSASK
jgi:hypothetical protein